VAFHEAEDARGLEGEGVRESGKAPKSGRRGHTLWSGEKKVEGWGERVG
jgi:hypothetical protein